MSNDNNGAKHVSASQRNYLSLSLSFSPSPWVLKEKLTYHQHSTLSRLRIIWSIESLGKRNQINESRTLKSFNVWCFTDNVFIVNSIESATTHGKYLALWMTDEGMFTVKFENPGAEWMLQQMPSCIQVKDNLCESYHLTNKHFSFY